MEFSNGLAQQFQQPATYANSAPTYIANGLAGATNTVQNKLTRSYFTDADPSAYQNYLAYPVYSLNDKGQQIGTNGGVVKVQWRAPLGTLTSTSGYQRLNYQASNSSTVWDVSQDGGFQIRYDQYSEELKFAASAGELVDYTTGLYFFRSSSEQDVRTRFGADARAYNANAAQYTTLANNVVLLKNSLDRAYTGTIHVRGAPLGRRVRQCELASDAGPHARPARASRARSARRRRTR